MEMPSSEVKNILVRLLIFYSEDKRGRLVYNRKRYIYHCLIARCSGIKFEHELRIGLQALGIAILRF